MKQDFPRGSSALGFRLRPPGFAATREGKPGLRMCPWPVRGLRHQTSSNWVVANIGDDLVILLLAARPMVEPFSLPEALSLAVENPIGFTRCVLLEALHDGADT